MILAIHVGVALASIAWATLTYFKPSQRKFNISYGLIAGTIASGTGLIIVSNANMLHMCISGIFYTTLVSIITITAHRRYLAISAVKETSN